MQTSSPTSQRPGQPKQILLIGPPGGGKTTLALQFPNVYFADCDMNLDGPVLRHRKLNPNLEYRYDCIPIDENGVNRAPKDLWRYTMSCLIAANKDPWVKTIVIDGLTYLNYYLIQHVQGLQGKDSMTIQDWIPFRNAMISFLSGMRVSKKTLIITCHEEIKTRIVKGQEELIGYFPSVSSKLSDFFGGFFTDTWRCLLIPGGNNQLWAQPTSVSPDLKSSIGLPQTIDNITYAKLKTYWDFETNQKPL